MVIKEFDKVNGILIIKYIGKVKIDEIIDYIKSVGDNELLPRELKILEYTNNIEYAFNVSDVKKIVELLETEIMPEFKSVRMCIIQSGTKETAYTMLFKHKIKINNYTYKIFSEEAAAKEWLLNEL